MDNNFMQSLPPEVLEMLMQQQPPDMSGMSRPVGPKEKSSFRRALELLVPLSLAAGGAYYGYKKIPQLVNYAKNPKGISGADIKNLVGQYNMDIGHALDRLYRSYGPKGNII
jgi:hypothetical protein